MKKIIRLALFSLLIAITQYAMAGKAKSIIGDYSAVIDLTIINEEDLKTKDPCVSAMTRVQKATKLNSKECRELVTAILKRKLLKGDVFVSLKPISEVKWMLVPRDQVTPEDKTLFDGFLEKR